jgi:hypothetical protein
MMDDNIRRLLSNDWEVRRDATQALGQIGDVRAVEPLIAALKDRDWDVRRAAAQALGLIGDVRGVEPLIVTLKDRFDGVRKAAAQALGKIGDVRAVMPLIAALKDQSWQVSEAAAQILGQIRDTRAVEPLIAALEDRDWDVRRAAAQALGQIGDARAVEPLIASLIDRSKYVRQAATQALGKIGVPCAIDPLLENRKLSQIEDYANAVIRDISKHNVNKFQSIWQGCVCQEHMNHFIKSNRSISLFQSITFYACRTCQRTEPSYRGISQVIAVVDVSAWQLTIVQHDNLLYVPWSLERGIFDFDTVEIHQATSSQIETFLLKFDEDEDPARPWKQKRGRKIQCRVLPTCPITPADRARLQRHFEVVDGHDGNGK